MRAWLTLGLWSLVAFLVGVINQSARGAFPFLPAPETASGTALGIAYLAVLLAALLFAARSAARLPHSTPFLLVAGLLFAAPLAFVIGLARLGGHAPWPLALAANNLFLPIAAALAGAGIGRVIRHPNTLIAAAGFGVFFDIVQVTAGTVAVMLQNNSKFVAAVSVGGGVAAAPSAPGVPPPPPPLSGVTIGPADVLFVAVFLSGIGLLRLSERATLGWMFALLLAALAYVEITGAPVPALAPMGLAVILANARHARFTRQEKFALVYGTGFALVLAVLLVAGARGVLGGNGGDTTPRRPSAVPAPVAPIRATP